MDAPLLIIRFAFRRVLQTIPMLFGLLTLVFFMSRLLAGDAADLFLSPTISPAMVEQLRIQFGLDKPIPEQYLLWMSSAVRGDLGYSFMLNLPVTEVLSSVVPNSLLLGSAALLIEVSATVLLARIAFQKPEGVLDRFMTNGTLIGYSLPSFWIGLMLVTIFSYGLGLFPSSHMHTADASSLSPAGSLIDLLWHLILPALTIAIPGTAGLARYLRASIHQTLQQDYLLAATGLGVSRRRLFWSYLLPNSAGPVVSQLGVELGVVLTGVLVTEVLFSWPGMGRVAIAAIFARDYPLILGCTLVAGIFVTIGNLLADIAHAALDPRLRLDDKRVA